MGVAEPGPGEQEAPPLGAPLGRTLVLGELSLVLVGEEHTEEHARQLGEQVMNINDLNGFSNFARKLATVQREHGEQGEFRAS